MRKSVSRPGSTAVRIQNLRFHWKGRADWALNIPELSLHAGESVFLHGPSGCGKSTLISLLAGVTSPMSGSLEVLGSHLHDMKGSEKDRFRANHIGLIFQMFNLVPFLSVMDNVILPCRFSRTRSDRVTQQGASVQESAGLLLDRLGLGQESIRDARAGSLSVGQQQRVAVARALIGSPELIIADEPTSALDNDRRSEFVELLFSESRAKGTTILFVSHDLTLSPHFDRVLAFQDICSI